MKDKINPYYLERYFTLQNIPKNFIFDKCSNDLMEFAMQNLASHKTNVDPIILKFTPEHDEMLAKLYKSCDSYFDKQGGTGPHDLKHKICALSYFEAKFLYQTLRDAENYSKSIALRFITKRSVPDSVSFEIIDNRT